MTNKTFGSYRSYDGLTDIEYTVWMPDSAPRAMVQIVHGMNEYVDRYDEFARFLADNGMVVFGNDHLGHGRTAKGEADLGYFAAKDGDRCLVEDVYSLNKIMRKKYRSLPCILLGHSMGSFVSRTFVSVHPDAADAFIISGTAGKGRPFGLGIALCSLIAKFKGDRHRSKFIKYLVFSKYNKRFDGDLGIEWVTTDLEGQRENGGDPKCIFDFTLGGYRDMFRLLSYVNSDEWYANMPSALPTLFMSGEDDPVGNYSKGVRQVAERLAETSSDVTLKIYEGERHELLTGLSKNKVFDDLLAWMNERIDGIIAARTYGTFPTKGGL